MQTKRFDGTDVRRVLIAMATNKAVLGRISTRWTARGLFNSVWADLVGGWCVSHYRKFGTPPTNKLVHRFEKWAEQHEGEKTVVEAVERFLHALSNQSDHEPVQEVEYLVHLAEQVFTQASLQEAVTRVRAELDGGRLTEAQQEWHKHRAVSLGENSYSEALTDFGEFDSYFQEERRRPLVTYQGDAGEFFGDALCRGEFYSFMGPDKTGKTSYMRDLAYRALRRKQQVAYFDTGDGGLGEFYTALSCRGTGTALSRTLARNYPLDWDKETKKFTTEERWISMVESIDGFRHLRKIARTERALRVEAFPNGTVSVLGLDARLDQWAQDGWVPDVVVVDYADILAPPEGIDDPLEQIDETWRALRRMSQSRNCLVVTATQSSAAAYGREQGLLTRKHFSGRKTKLAHVNGMIGINVSEDERKVQQGRLNWVVRRSKSRHRGFVHVAGCFDAENPIVLSHW